MTEAPGHSITERKPAASLKARSSYGVVWGLLDSVGQQVVSLAVFVFLGRLLSPALFGVVSTALVFVFLMRSTLLNAVSTALVAIESPKSIDYDTAFWIVGAISLFSAVLLNTAAGFLASAYTIAEIEPVVRWTSVIVVCFGLSYAHYGWARKNFRFKALAIRNIAGVTAGGAAGIALALCGYGLTALVANQLIASLVSLGLLWISIPWRPRFRFSRCSARRILETALPLGTAQGVMFAAQNVDTAIVTYLLGAFAGGLYAAAKRIALSIQLVLWGPIAAALLPTLAEVADDRVRYERLQSLASGLVMALAAPALLGVSVVSTDLLHAFFGEKWLGAAPVLSILALTTIAIPASGVLLQTLLIRKRAPTLLYFALFQVCLAVAAVIVFKDAGVAAITLCLSLPSVISWIVLAAYLIYIGELRFLAYCQAVLRPLSAALAMALAVLAVPSFGSGPWASLLVHVSVGIVVYAIVLWLIARDIARASIGLAGDVLPARLRARLAIFR